MPPLSLLTQQRTPASVAERQKQGAICSNWPATLSRAGCYFDAIDGFRMSAFTRTFCGHAIAHCRALASTFSMAACTRRPAIDIFKPISARHRGRHELGLPLQ